jgi:hypothetical protein
VRQCLEPFTFPGIGKYNPAQRRAIQQPVGCNHLAAEVFAYRSQCRTARLDNFPGNDIGINNRYAHASQDVR